jgi:hypothetical protein
MVFLTQTDGFGVFGGLGNSFPTTGGLLQQAYQLVEEDQLGGILVTVRDGDPLPFTRPSAPGHHVDLR